MKMHKLIKVMVIAVVGLFAASAEADSQFKQQFDEIELLTRFSCLPTPDSIKNSWEQVNLALQESAFSAKDVANWVYLYRIVKQELSNQQLTKEYKHSRIKQLESAPVLHFLARFVNVKKWDGPHKYGEVAGTIKQHIGKGTYLLDTGYRWIVVISKNDNLLDGQPKIFYGYLTNEIYDYTTVTGANKRVQVFVAFD